MTYENMTNEERGFFDKFKFYSDEKIEVHLTLHKTLKDGSNLWYNGFLTATSSDKIWMIKDRVLGNIKIALIEIKKVEEVK